MFSIFASPNCTLSPLPSPRWFQFPRPKMLWQSGSLRIVPGLFLRPDDSTSSGKAPVLERALSLQKPLLSVLVLLRKLKDGGNKGGNNAYVKHFRIPSSPSIPLLGQCIQDGGNGLPPMSARWLGGACRARRDTLFFNFDKKPSFGWKNEMRTS